MRFAHFVSLAIKTWGCWQVDAPRLKEAYSKHPAGRMFVYRCGSARDLYKNGQSNRGDSSSGALT